MKTLIVYGTRYGATANTAEEIAKTLREENFDIKVVNAKEKIKDISPYELIIVGSGLQMGKWVGDAEDFLKKHQNDFSNKKLAIFASTMKMMPQKEGDTKAVDEIRKAALEEKIAKYNLQPISEGFFGGILNYNKMNLIFRRTMGFMKPQLEKDGFKETEPNVYEMRDLEEIKSWAKELANKVKQ